MGIEGQRPGGAAGRNDRHLPRRNPWLRSQNCIKLLVSSLTPCRWIEQGYWTQFRLVSRGTSQCRCSSSAPNEGCDPVLRNQWAFQPAIQENHSFMLLLDDAGWCACVYKRGSEGSPTNKTPPIPMIQLCAVYKHIQTICTCISFGQHSNTCPHSISLAIF